MLSKKTKAMVIANFILLLLGIFLYGAGIPKIGVGVILFSAAVFFVIFFSWWWNQS